MRTFHTGGVATGALTENDIKASTTGTVQHRDINAVQVTDAEGNKLLVALKRNGELAIVDPKGRELEKFKVPYGAVVTVPDGEKVKPRQTVIMWDPHITPILAEKAGIVRYEDIEEGETVRVEEEKKGAGGKLVVIEHKGERHPRITSKAPTARFSTSTTCLQRLVSKLPTARRSRPARCWPASPARPAAPWTSPAVSPASPKSSKPASQKIPRFSRKFPAPSNFGMIGVAAK